MTTAKWLAQRLAVSERTVYRDVADLQYQGVPIEGEAGVGYRLGAGFDLPPLIFTLQEAQALVVMTRLRSSGWTQRWRGPVSRRCRGCSVSCPLTSAMRRSTRRCIRHLGA